MEDGKGVYLGALVDEGIAAEGAASFTVCDIAREGRGRTKIVRRVTTALIPVLAQSPYGRGLVYSLRP